MLFIKLLMLIFVTSSASASDHDYSKFRQARDTIGDVLSVKIQRYGSDYFFGTDDQINQIVLADALKAAMKTIKGFPIRYIIKVQRNAYPSHTLVADIVVTYADQISSISWNYNITLIPGSPPFFHRECLGHSSRPIPVHYRVSL
jgi:hypothetical protein